MAGINLSNKYLSSTDLTNINLSQADLRNASFSFANLTGADLIGADVRGAAFNVDHEYAGGSGLTTTQLYSTASYQSHDLAAIKLNGGIFVGANFVGKNLASAGFASATLTNANFSQANLTNVDFSGAILTGANFSGASIEGANFSSSGIAPTQLYSTASYLAHDLSGIRLNGYGDNLVGVNLTGKNLTNADFSGGNNLTNANFSQANLRNANFNSATLTGANFADAEVRGADFSRDASYGTGITKAQLYSTASYAAHDLTGINLGNNNLAGANFVAQNLTNAKFYNASLNNANLSQANLTNAIIYNPITGVNLTGAEIRGASLPGITKAQLYSTASYQSHDLTGIILYDHDLKGANFAGQDLTNADIRHSDLDNANFSGANLTNAIVWAGLNGANFSNAIIRGGEFTAITKAQIYSTASYHNRDLAGIRLQYFMDLSGVDFSFQNLTNANLRSANLTGANLSRANLTNAMFGGVYYTANLQNANLSHANLTNADFSGSYYCDEYDCYPLSGVNLTNANLIGADARGASMLNAILDGASTTNFIQSNGHIAGLNLTAGKSLTIRDYDGNLAAYPTPTGPLPIVIDQNMTMNSTGTLRLEFDADHWDSTISFAAGIPVTRGGNLELYFATDVNLASQIGRTIDLFDWTGVNPTGMFSVSSPYTWNLSNLYTTGEVTLSSVPEILSGDFDDSGLVNAADFVLWRDSLRGSEGYTLWRSNFGEISGAGSSSGGTIPEPSAFSLFIVIVTVRALRCIGRNNHRGAAGPDSPAWAVPAVRREW